LIRLAAVAQSATPTTLRRRSHNSSTRRTAAIFAGDRARPTPRRTRRCSPRPARVSLARCKGDGDYLDSEAGKIELAQDVARFANAEQGGLLVLGIATAKRDGADTLTKLTPIKHERATPSRYSAVLNRRLFPPPFAARSRARSSVSCVVVLRTRFPFQQQPSTRRWRRDGALLRQGEITKPEGPRPIQRPKLGRPSLCIRHASSGILARPRQAEERSVGRELRREAGTPPAGVDL
jgi:hypothetical protein